jgi:hypothetical protein
VLLIVVASLAISRPARRAMQQNPNHRSARGVTPKSGGPTRVFRQLRRIQWHFCELNLCSLDRTAAIRRAT